MELVRYTHVSEDMIEGGAIQVFCRIRPAVNSQDSLEAHEEKVWFTSIASFFRSVLAIDIHDNVITISWLKSSINMRLLGCSCVDTDNLVDYRLTRNEAEVDLRRSSRDCTL